MFPPPFDLPLGVVPVFFNVGAALLPAILAALASVGAILLRPGELVRACRARPGTALAVVAGVAGTVVLVGWLLIPARPDVGRRTGAHARPGSEALRIDWAAEAVRWLAEEKTAGISPLAPAVPQTGPVIFRQNPLRNGYAGGGSPARLTPAWSFPAPGSKAAEDLGNAMFLASPTVAGGAVYGGSCLVDPLGNYGTLFCLDAATGAPRWMTSFYKDDSGTECQFKGFFSSPAISADGNYLVIGQGLHNDENCDLVCVDARTGRLRWRVKTPLHIEGSPAIEGDLAVAGAGAVEAGSDHKAQGHPGIVIAVKISSGEKLWEYQLNDPESSPAIKDGIVYIGSGFNGNAVVALRSESDEELKRKGLARLLWRTATPCPATGAVTLAGDLVLVGCGNGDYVFTDPRPEGAVLALDRQTGTIRWTVKMPDAVLGAIAVQGSLAAAPVRKGEVVALDLAAADDQRVRWRQRVHGEKPVLAGPAVTESLVYVVSQDGCLAVLDAKDGRVLQRQQLNAPNKPGDMGLSVSSPAVAAGRLYVGSETGGLRCFAPAKR